MVKRTRQKVISDPPLSEGAVIFLLSDSGLTENNSMASSMMIIEENISHHLPVVGTVFRESVEDTASFRKNTALIDHLRISKKFKWKLPTPRNGSSDQTKYHLIAFHQFFVRDIGHTLRDQPSTHASHCASDSEDGDASKIFI